MDQQLRQIELIRGAQKGNRRCQELLAREAKGRLYTYVYRLTQRDDLSQEIVQESLVEMFKVLGKLRKTDRFWPWLYGIATNKLRRHYRTQQTHRRAIQHSLQRKQSATQRQEGFENLVREELQQIISKAMNKLKTRHKAVLVMRCYDDMAYSDIAETLGCSEFSTRMLFMRAKKALQKELSKNGFHKGALVAALVLFGKMTAPSKVAAAQVSISAATVNAGLVAGIAGLATTKAAIVSIAAAGALSVGTVAVTTGSLFDGKAPETSSYLQIDRNSSQNKDFLYYFPQGPEEAMMFNATFAATNKEPLRRVLQNEQANYYYEDNTAYINNYRVWNSDLTVMKLPTDDLQLTNFICRIESSTSDMEHVSATGRNLLVVAVHSEGGNNDSPITLRHHNLLDEDYFLANWPLNTRIIDNRDQMHKRGWTYFEITGQINGRDVTGSGRIPFVYQASEENSPWLELQIGDLLIVDTDRMTYVYNSSNDKVYIYNENSFFKGLGRPWMGLHTIDAIRRDAAEKRISFDTQLSENGRFAIVEIPFDNLQLSYKIDLEADVIDEIIFAANQKQMGNLKFSYLQSIEQIEGQFKLPGRAAGSARTSRPESGISWLAQLADGELE